MADGIEYTGTLAGPAPEEKLSVEEIRAKSRRIVEESRRSAPQSWARIDAAKAQAVGHRVGSILLGERLLTEAQENGEISDESASNARFAIYRELERESPEAFEALVMELNDRDLDMLDDYEEPPDRSQLSGNQLYAAVARADRAEEAASKLAHSSAMIAGITGMNQEKFEAGLRELGILSNDPNAVDYYEAVSDYVADTVGYRPSQIAAEHPEHALTLMERAQDQLSAQGFELARREFGKQILVAEDGTIASGLETGTDRTVAKMDELISTIREASGKPAVEITPFDPELVIEAREEESDPSETIAEFKESLTDGEGLKASDAWTIGEPGSEQPTTFTEVTRDLQAEERTEREARESATGLPRSFH